MVFLPCPTSQGPLGQVHVYVRSVPCGIPPVLQIRMRVVPNCRVVVESSVEVGVYPSRITVTGRGETVGLLCTTVVVGTVFTKVMYVATVRF